jgi:predicted alpha/beta superfamily hydrolase
MMPMTRMTRSAVLAALLILTFSGGETKTVSAKQEPPPCSVVGDLKIRPFVSAVFHNTRMLRVWLPPEYNSPQQRNTRYPVLYLNDGQDLFDACTSIFNRQEWRVDETATDLIANRRVPPLIIVGIDNAGKRDRPNEYLPFPDNTLTPAVTQVHGKDYPRFLLDEVMPFINAHYRTDPSSMNTGIGGSSYGAGIALYTVMMRPGRFGKLLLESPSIYAHNDYLIHRAQTFTQWPAKVYIGVGSVNEPVEDVQRLQTTLLNHGLGNQRLLVIKEQGPAHNEAAWAGRFPRALEFLYPEPPPQSSH